MTRQLTTQNATITTAAVEVKTLTVSGKQVTLAVFRQLREEPLLAEDGTLNGVPWGIVNYHPDKCGESQFPHWHVVWQHGSELRRARLDHAAPFAVGGRDEDGYPRHRPKLFTSETADKVLTAAVLAWLTGCRESCPLPETGERWIGGRYYRSSAHYDSGHGFKVEASASQTALAAANARASLVHAQKDAATAQEELASNRASGSQTWARDFGEGALRGAQGRAEEWLVKDVQAHDALAEEIRLWGTADGQVTREHTAAVQAEADWRQTYLDALAVIAELPQLFIAV